MPAAIQVARRRPYTHSTMIAMPPYRARAAAVWPEGKLDVGGAASSRATGGRASWMAKVSARKISSSPAMTVMKIPDSCHRPSRQRSSSTTTTVTPMAVVVWAMVVPM